MIYVSDSRRVRRKTLSKCPQENAECAAVFWRNGESCQKPHFSTRNPYPHSITPCWTNTISHINTQQCKVGEKRLRFHDYDLTKSVLHQWCKPGGLCYSPIAESFAFVLACVDLGIQFVGLQENAEVFEGIIEKLLLDKEKRDRTEQIVSNVDRELGVKNSN